MSKKPTSRKPKAPKVPASDRSVGYDHNKLSEEQHAALAMQHAVKIEAALAKVAAATADVRNLRKVAKSDGIDSAEMNYVLYLRKQNPEDVLAQAKMQARVAKYLAHPLGTQFGMFEDDRTPIAERAYAEGKSAGLEGKDFKSPYDASTEAGQEWMKGWHDGQAVLAKGLRTKAEDEPGHQRHIPAEPNDEIDDETEGARDGSDDEADAAWSGNAPSRVS